MSRVNHVVYEDERTAARRSGGRKIRTRCGRKIRALPINMSRDACTACLIATVEDFNDAVDRLGS